MRAIPAKAVGVAGIGAKAVAPVNARVESRAPRGRGALSLLHFILEPAERTTCHLPARFSSKSIQRNTPSALLPSRIRFSVTLPFAERLAVKTRGELVFLNAADVDWIESVGYYACLHVGGNTHVLRRSLLELERNLDAEQFMRIHRSIMVNLERIHKLELQDGGDYEVILRSGDRLRLSRRFRRSLLDRMKSKGI
jgi:DNA-binding LytR/AlgR family response regulator